tara:strand:+ start:893 stop:1432 length:540 start_codon:yes stop_codon:yes gene_type:complete
MSLVFHPNGTIEGFNGNSMPSGAVIQAKYAKDTSSQNWQQSGLGAWADLPNLSLSITPTSSSNKILVLAHACGGEQSTIYGLWFRVIRDSTPLGGAATGSRQSVSMGHVSNSTYTDDQMGSSSFSYMDEPASTSSLTYKVQGICRYSPHNWSYNKSYDDNTGGAFAQGVSTLTLLEVKG